MSEAPTYTDDLDTDPDYDRLDDDGLDDDGLDDDGLDDDELDDEDDLDEDQEDEDDDLDEDQEDEDEGDGLDDDEADEVVLDLLDTISVAEELDRDQVRDLGLLLGDKRAGLALGRALNEEAKQAQAGRPKRRRGWWHWWFGPGHEQGDPIPDGLAALLLRISEGWPLDWNDFTRLGKVVGRRSVRLLEGLIHGAVVRDQDRTRGRGGRR
jgi:hypothetical protein